MQGKYADLHTHTLYSDGSMTPQELVTDAIKSNVGLFAIADHDLLEGSLAAREICENAGIRLLPAVEIDTFENNKNFHVLAYDFDINNTEFLRFLSATRFMLEESGYRLIEAMQKDYPQLSIADLDAFEYSAANGGGWKELHYFMAKGITTSLKEGVWFYPKYGINYANNGYSSISAAAFRIRKAGGYSVLAHPGELIDYSDLDAFRDELEQIVSMGIDGIECYYPSHTPEVTQICLDVCKLHDLYITSGSDCHGLFGKPGTHVGCMNIEIEKLRLRN